MASLGLSPQGGRPRGAGLWLCRALAYLLMDGAWGAAKAPRAARGSRGEKSADPKNYSRLSGARIFSRSGEAGAGAGMGAGHR
jgi:hypothetical protein